MYRELEDYLLRGFFQANRMMGELGRENPAITTRLEKYKCLDSRRVCSQGHFLPGWRLTSLSSQRDPTLAAQIIFLA